MARVAALVVSVAILLSLCTLVFAQEVSDEAKAHYEAGMTAKTAKNFDEAIFELRLAVELEPEYLDANWALAWTYAAFEDRRQDLAVGYFQKVIELAPGTEKARQAGEAIKRIQGEAEQPEPAVPVTPAAPVVEPPEMPQPEVGPVEPEPEIGLPSEMNPAPRMFRTPEPPADAKAGDIWVCPTDGAEMILIPAGEFLFGPQQDITTTDAFWIDRYEVSNGQYAAFMAEAGHKAPAAAQGAGAEALNWQEGHWPGWLGDTFPVTGVTLQDAHAYARWAGKRLPTEEEWEKAARGLDGRAYPWGNEWNGVLCVTVNAQEGMPLPVGSLPDGASPWGLLDMAGNVWEWTASPWEPGSQSAVIRGGSFAVADEDFFTTFWRGASEPGLAAHNGGLRCAMSAARVQAQPAQPPAPQPPVAIGVTTENIIGTWRLKGARQLGANWGAAGMGAVEIAADGTFTHITPAAGGGQRTVTGTWELQGDQLTFTWLKNVLPDGTEREFNPPRVYQNTAELYEGGRTLVTTYLDDNMQQAWERQ